MWLALAEWFESHARRGFVPLGEVRGAGPPANDFRRPLGIVTSNTLKMDSVSKAYTPIKVTVTSL